nr:membrane hypothetical protein [Rhizobiaceae bacterium]
MALDQEGLAGILVEDLVHRLGHPAQRRGLVHRDLRRARGEGDRVEVDTAHLVADTGRILHLVERIDTLDRLDRGSSQEVAIVDAVFRGRVDDIFIDRDGQAHRRQPLAGIDEGRPAVAVDFRRVEHHIFPAAAVDARALDDFAVAVADGDDAVTVRPLDDLAHAAVRQILVIGLRGAARQAAAVVGTHDDAVAEIDHEAVVDLALDAPAVAVLVARPAVAALAPLPVARLVADAVTPFPADLRIAVGFGNAHAHVAALLLAFAAQFLARAVAAVVPVLVAVENRGTVDERQLDRPGRARRVAGDALALLVALAARTPRRLVRALALPFGLALALLAVALPLLALALLVAFGITLALAAFLARLLLVVLPALFLPLGVALLLAAFLTGALLVLFLALLVALRIALALAALLARLLLVVLPALLLPLGVTLLLAAFLAVALLVLLLALLVALGVTLALAAFLARLLLVVLLALFIALALAALLAGAVQLFLGFAVVLAATVILAVALALLPALVAVALVLAVAALGNEQVVAELPFLGLHRNDTRRTGQRQHGPHHGGLDRLPDKRQRSDGQGHRCQKSCSLKHWRFLVCQRSTLLHQGLGRICVSAQVARLRYQTLIHVR